ncbi:hypothetical protein N9B82_01910 [Saprospiraceae bacterium]|nr:hypothetical protein [Saprospiraceae bacterium]
MKILLLVICFGLSFSATAQKKEKEKTERSSTFIKVQGGLLVDVHPQVSYIGFNQINIGLDRIKKNRYEGISLEFIGYEAEYETESDLSQFPTMWSKTRTSFELEYFRSLLHIGKGINGLYFGPTASLNFRNNVIEANTPSEFPFTDNYYGLGLGGKALYLVELTNRLSLNVGTKITVFDFGLSRYTNMNPNIPIVQQTSTIIDVDLPRSQFQLLLGLNFKLS